MNFVLQVTNEQGLGTRLGLTHKTSGLLTQIGILPNIVIKLGSFDVHVRMMNFVKVYVSYMFAITSMMIYHRGVSLSKQRTDLLMSLHKAGFVTHK